MKMVSAAKLKRAQDAIIQLRPYARKLKEILENLSQSLDESVQSPYAQVREVKNILCVVVTSDKGLCGAFNSNVLRITSAFVAENKNTALEFLCVGKKGHDYFSKRKFKVVGDYRGFFRNPGFEKSEEIAKLVMKGFLEKRWDKVVIFYNEFKNVATQKRVTEQFLPMPKSEETEKKSKKSFQTDYILEPSREYIIRELIPESLKIQFYRTLLESNAAEQGARMIAMDSATENAKEMIRTLTIHYNRARQAAITKEILEVVGGAEALKG